MVFTNAIASGSTSSNSVNEAKAIIVLSGTVDLSDGKVSDADHSYFDEFDSSTHKRKHEDIVYEIGSNKAIIGVNGAKVAFGGLQIYANKCERGNIIIQNIDFWDAHGSTEEDTTYNTKSKASADSLVLESNGTTKDSNGYITYNYVPKNIWIDHCKFSDGTCKDLERNYHHDGSLDMKAGQYVTVSYCEFTNHDKVTLLAPNDSYVAPEQRQITFHHNYYHGAIQRMPRSRGCQVHIYNNYYNDIGIEDNGGYSLGPGIGSQFIVENNCFGKHQTSKILKYFDTSKNGSSAATFSRLYQSGNNVTFSSSNMATDGDTASSVTDHLTTSVPWTIKYTYSKEANGELPTLIPTVAGTDKTGYTKTVKVNGVSY
ncbi:MAG: polysaccharide lyase family 1 protein [Treponema sp.]|nr:polysaccharide lyase family 1 protein [Treponema sp.]